MNITFITNAGIKYGDSFTNADYKRYNFRSNFDIDVIKNLQMSFNLAGQSSASTYPGANNSGNDIGSSYQNIIQNILETVFLQARIRMRIFIRM